MGWSQPANELGIESHYQITILGIQYGTTIAKSVKDSWAGALRSVCAQARKVYVRTLCLPQRIQYVHLCLLSKIWYVPPTKEHVQQLTTVCTRFSWQGAIFRVPVTTLQLPKQQGGWALANIGAKYKKLLYARLWFLCTVLLQHCWESGTYPDPLRTPNVHGLPTGISYIRHYALDMAYIPQQAHKEPWRSLKIVSTECC